MDAGAGVDMAGLMDTVRHRVEAEPGGSLASYDAKYRVAFTDDGFDLALRRVPESPIPAVAALTERHSSEPRSSRPRPGPVEFEATPAFGLRLAEVRLGSRVVSGAGQWVANANTAERQVGDALLERVTARTGELEWDFVVDAPPAEGDLSIDATVTSAGAAVPELLPIDPADPALGWALPNGRSVRMGETVVKDAAGAEIHRSLATVEGDRVHLDVPGEVLRQAPYPVTVDPVVSPEYPTTEPNYGEAYDWQYEPSIASAANGVLLVVWEDWRPYDTTDIYGTRVTASGQILDPVGIAISRRGGNQLTPAVAWNGTDFVVVWTDEEEDAVQADIYGARVSTSGAVRDPGGIGIAKSVADEREPAVAAAGSTVLVAWSSDPDPGQSDISGAVFAPTGEVGEETFVSVDFADEFSPSVATDGQEFVVVWGEGDPVGRGTQVVSGIRAQRVSVTGVPLSFVSQTIAVTPGFQVDPDIAWNGTHYLVVWNDIRNAPDLDWDIYGARLLPVGRGLQSLDPRGVPIGSTPDVIEETPSVTSDGTGFLVAWSAPDVRAASVQTNAVAVSVGPENAVSTNADPWGAAPDVAWSGSLFFGVWTGVRTNSDDMGVYGSRLTPEGAPSDVPTLTLSKSASAQREPAVASDGTNALVVWSDGRPGWPYKDIYAARITPTGELLDPAGIAVSTAPGSPYLPDVAWDGTQFVVAWADVRMGGSIYTARVTPGGHVIDPDGIRVTTAESIPGAPRIASTSGTSLIAWTEYDLVPDVHTAVHAARLGPGGAVIDQGGFAVSSADLALAPDVAASATQFLVTWEEEVVCVEPSCFDDHTDVHARRIPLAGPPLSSPVIPLLNTDGDQFTPTAASNGTDFLVAWSDWTSGSPTSTDLYAVRVSAAGALVDSSLIVVSAASFGQFEAAVAWNGTAYVAAWIDYRNLQSGSGSDIYAARIDAAGQVRDPAGIHVATSAEDEGPVAVAGSPRGGATIVYQRFVAGDHNVVRSMLVMLRTTSAVSDFDASGTTDRAVFRPSSGTWFVQGGLTTGWGTQGDIPVPGDYDGDGDTDVAVFRPSNGIWFVQGGLTTGWGTQGDIPVPGDYDGDGDTDIAVFRPSNGVWFVQGGPTTAWGTQGDMPVPGDYDGDARTDIAVFRPSSGTWFVHASAGGNSALTYGTSGDVPVPGTYDGDARTDIAVFRPSGGTWFVRQSSDGGEAIAAYGAPGDVPLPLPDAIGRFFQ